MAAYSSKSIVKLNVGGKSFATFYETIAQSQYFVNLLSKDAFSNRTTVNNDEVFIDRSAQLFTGILCFLRTGTLIESKVEKLRSLQEESRFYQIDKMTKFCELEIKKALESKAEESSLLVMAAKDLKGDGNNYVVFGQPNNVYKTYKVIDVIDTRVNNFCHVHHRNTCNICTLSTKLILYPSSKRLN